MKPDAAAAEIGRLMQRAVTAHQRGDLDAAERDYRAALRAAPRHADAVHFLGLLLHQRERHPESVPLLERSLALTPGSALYRNNLAGVLKELGRYPEAEPLYHEALRLKPDYLDARVNLAMLYAAQGDHARAAATAKQALALDPTSYQAWRVRGEALLQLAETREALQSYRRARELAAGDADRLLDLGVLFREAGDVDGAQGIYEQAVKLRPDFPEAENSLGNVLGMQGDLAGAERHFRRAIGLKPRYLSAFHNLVGIARLVAGDPLWPPLMQLADHAAELPANEALLLHFTLGKVSEERGEYVPAFGHYLEGNRLKRATLDYDEARQAGFFQDLVRQFDAGAVAGAARDEERAVFIVGMPRSGTSLVEQILASHPAVHGAGETHALRNCLRAELPPEPSDYRLPEQLLAAEAAVFGRAAERYSRYLDALAPGARRVTNKLPGNMALVGVIHRLFPRARIVHCVRDPLDTCLSCFTKLFTTGHPFSYELGELGRFYRMYADLMQAWHARLPAAALFELRYEELVGDLEGQARRLVDYCGLPWDDACLRFHESSRAVRTASLAQVRRPLYASSVGRWRNYERQLKPLMDALSGK
ncbi:MAG TPA: sulfotransferase [Gammaproteobacteria bacterium]|nr:sulfotransferase [Gammaproteobacteria bacterium]